MNNIGDLPNYPDSYYKATVNEPLGYPQLQNEITSDITIIGGGFSGISTALSLAERGYKVVVLEEKRVGWGASGRNGGQMVGGFNSNTRVVKKIGKNGKQIVEEMLYRGHDIISDRVKRYNIKCDLNYGQMVVASKKSHIKDFEEEYKWHQQNGRSTKVKLYDKQSLHNVLDTNKYFGGIENQIDGSVHPLNLCLGQARACKELGVKIFEGSAVTKIIRNQKPICITPNGRVKSSILVIAGNAYHLLNIKFLADAIIPVASYIIATEKMSQKTVERTNPRNLAVYDSLNIIDYFRFSNDRRLLFGGRCDYSQEVQIDIKTVMLNRLIGVFPQFKNIKIDYAWQGNIAIVLNRIPMIGRVGSSIYYLQGFCGHGVSLTHNYADIIARMIDGDAKYFDHFSKIKHLFLPYGRGMSNYLLALGMQYYRIRDKMPF